MSQAMSASSPKRTGWVWPALLAVCAVLVLLQTCPWAVRTPNNDSGIFLFFGSQILHGKLPFVNLWDHKPPLVFYLDALGLGLAGGSRWGVWALEVISLLVASQSAFFFLRRSFRTWAAALAVLGMLFNLVYALEGGNLTEEYALAFQFAALLLFAGTQAGQKPGWRGYLIGACLAGAFLLKQTLIGVWIAISLYLLVAALFTRAWRGLKLFLPMAAGFMAVLLVSVVYFALRGALGAYWDVAFWYNFVYSSVAPMERIYSLQETLTFLTTRSGFFLLALMAWLAGLGYVLLHHQAARWLVTRRWVGLAFAAGGLLLLYNGLFVRGLQLYALKALSPYRWGLIAAGLVLLLVALVYGSRWMERRVFPWLETLSPACDSPALLPLYLALLDLPLNLALVSLPGRGYLHYNLALYPSLTLLAGFLVFAFQEQVGQPGHRSAMAWVWSAALVLPLVLGGALRTAQQIYPGSDLQSTQTVAYIQANTRPDDTILMWGTQTTIYYLSGRDAPTRYVHQIPLFNPNYATPERLDEFLNDLETRKPALIIDTRLKFLPLLYQAGDPAACEQAKPAEDDVVVPAGMGKIYAFICANYEAAGPLGKDNWLVYRYNPAIHSAGTAK